MRRRVRSFGCLPMNASLRTIVTLSLLAACFSQAAQRELTAEETMADVIEHVRANEKLYRNIDLVYRQTYQELRKNFAGKQAANRAQSIIQRARFIQQNGLIYFDSTQTLKFFNGDTNVNRFKQGYDGQLTRLVETGAQNVAKTQKGRLRDPRLPYIHMLISVGSRHKQSLSDYLGSTTGGNEIVEFKWQVLGDETVGDLQCVKVRRQHVVRKKGKITWQGDYWLARERNYLPVKIHGWRQVGIGQLPPRTVALAEDLREIEPGVWIPFRVSKTVADIAAKRKGRHEPGYRWDSVIEKTVLNPDYGIELFREIEIPER